MIIKYKNTFGKDITHQQAEQLNKFLIQYVEDDGLVSREEEISNGELFLEFIHNWNNMCHQQLISLYPEAVIIDHIKYLNGYRLEVGSVYDANNIIHTHTHTLYDLNNKKVAFESIIDREGGTIYDRWKKYWDLAVSPDWELFESIYNQETGQISLLDFNNKHYDILGQSSYWINAGDVQRLMQETGMSQELAEYYFSPEIVPPWEEA